MNFTGVFAIATTPFTDSGSLDLEALGKKTEFLIKCGVEAIVPTGSVGECSALTDDERVEVWSAVKEAAQGRVGVIASTIHTATGHAIRLSLEAERLGLDGIMNMPPYYWALTDDAYLAHFQQLSAACSLPIMMYNNVNVTRVDMSPELIDRIADVPNVQAIKETTPRLLKLEQVLDRAGDRIAVLNGMSVFHEPYAAMMGCPGMVDPFANFLGPTTSRIWRLSKQGDYEGALDLKRKAVSPITNFLFGMRSVPDIIAAYKYVERSLGLLPCARCRPPIFDISDAEKAELDRLLEQTEPYRLTV